MKSFALAAAVAGVTITTAATAQAAVLSGDTYVEINDLFDTSPPTQTRNTQPFFSVRDDNSTEPDSRSDRVGVLYFDLSGDAGTGTSAGSSLTVKLGAAAAGAASVANPVTLTLWGVADGAAEDDFTNAGYQVTSSNTLGNAIDASGNRVRESNTFDFDPGTSTTFQALDEVALTDLSGLVAGTTISFSGIDLDTFVSSVSDGDGSDTDLAFLLTATAPGSGVNNEFRFETLETSGGSPANLAVVVPEPTGALAILGGLGVLAMRRRPA
jgi:hypothetical protein